MSTIDHTRAIAPIAFDLSDQVTPEPTFNPAFVNSRELLELAEQMAPFGDNSFQDVVSRIWDASNAITAAMTRLGQPSVDASGLLDLDADAIADRVVTAAGDYAIFETLAFARVQEGFDRGLVRESQAALRAGADKVVAGLRRDFDKHAKVVTAASKAGLSQHTDPSELLQSADTATLEAYRGLPAAVTGLDAVAALRTRMSQYLAYGPVSLPVTAFIKSAAGRADLQSAGSVFAGETEWRQYHQAVGAAHIKVHKRVVGGCWLALVNSGYALHLNTAAEATAVAGA